MAGRFFNTSLGSPLGEWMEPNGLGGLVCVCVCVPVCRFPSGYLIPGSSS